jgi:hypothetical protein
MAHQIENPSEAGARPFVYSLPTMLQWEEFAMLLKHLKHTHRVLIHTYTHLLIHPENLFYLPHIYSAIEAKGGTLPSSPLQNASWHSSLASTFGVAVGAVARDACSYGAPCHPD